MRARTETVIAGHGGTAAGLVVTEAARVERVQGHEIAKIETAVGGDVGAALADGQVRIFEQGIEATP